MASPHRQNAAAPLIRSAENTRYDPPLSPVERTLGRPVLYSNSNFLLLSTKRVCSNKHHVYSLGNPWYYDHEADLLS